MIDGHGDDIFRYPQIRMNFSSNICQHLSHERLRQHLYDRFQVVANYPEPEAWTLERTLAEKLGVDPACVMVTNGATEAIYLIAQAYGHLGYEVAGPTFSEYEDACRLFGAQHCQGALTWVCNPNNPTGQVRTLDTWRRARLLVVDQAYEYYTPRPLISDREAVASEQIILLHSMTKTYGVPGLRLGYLTAAPSIVDHLRRFLRPWSVNALAIEAGLFLTAHDELRVKPDWKEADRLRSQLEKLPGISVMPTDTQFMLCRVHNCTAAQLKDVLALKYGILIRDAANFQGLTVHDFRVAAQTTEENDALVDAIRQVLNTDLKRL